MAEYDWALTVKSRAEIHEKLMEKKLLPDFGLPVSRVSYMDGCKVYFEEGWIIARFSGTEPRVRIFAEMPTKARARELVRTIEAAAAKSRAGIATGSKKRYNRPIDTTESGGGRDDFSAGLCQGAGS